MKVHRITQVCGVYIIFSIVLILGFPSRVELQSLEESNTTQELNSSNTGVVAGNDTEDGNATLLAVNSTMDDYTEDEFESANVTTLTMTTEEEEEEDDDGWNSTSPTTPRPTFPTVNPRPTNPTENSTDEPVIILIESANPPTWAIVLISLMVSFSLVFTIMFFLRRYCARKRKDERRYLLARSQEGFFFGEHTSGQFNENL